MTILVSNVEDWIVPHLKSTFEIEYFHRLSHSNIDSFSQDKTLLISFENINEFSEIGSISDILNLVSKMKLLKKIIYLSSYGVYYPKNDPYKELDRVSPMNLVGVKAAMLEDVLIYLARRFNLNLTILRLFNVYGPFQISPYIIPTILEKIVLGGTITIGDYQKVRDFIYISDFVEIIKLINEKTDNGLEIYNVGCGTGYSIHDLIDLSQRITENRCNVLFDATKLREEYDYDYAVADISKIKKELNWQPKIDLKMGLSLTYQWILGRSGKNV